MQVVTLRFVVVSPHRSADQPAHAGDTTRPEARPVSMYSLFMQAFYRLQLIFDTLETTVCNSVSVRKWQWLAHSTSHCINACQFPVHVEGDLLS
jgi:hypothetical protein